MSNVHKFSKAIVNFELDDKLRRLLNFVTFLSITKNHEQISALMVARKAIAAAENASTQAETRQTE